MKIFLDTYLFEILFEHPVSRDFVVVLLLLLKGSMNLLRTISPTIFHVHFDFYGKSVILRHQPFHRLFVIYFTHALGRFTYTLMSIDFLSIFSCFS